MQIKAGVPQGSIIGPLLFILFINDVFDLNLNGKISLYADDAMLIYTASSIKDLHNVMQEDLRTLNNYFLINCLQVNKKKNMLHVDW